MIGRSTMQSDFILLTDMINAKMLGIYDLIDKWMPQQHTIKKMVLHDINFIEKEISLFQNKQHHTPAGSNRCNNNRKTKCRNGNNCWYLKQGRCWFYHVTGNMSDTVPNEQQPNEPKQVKCNSNNNVTTGTTSNNNHSITTPTSPTTSPKKSTKKSAKSQQNTPKNSNNNKSKKKKTRRRRKKKKFDIDAIIQSLGYGNDSDRDNEVYTSENNDCATKEQVGNIYLSHFNDIVFDTIDKKNSYQ